MVAARSVATALVVALALLLSGCSMLGGPTCGPGDTEIGSIEGNATSVTVKGELIEANGSSLLVTDGTGTIELLVIGGYDESEVSPGDCIIAEGPASESDADEQYDASMIPVNLWEEEVVLATEE